MKEEQAIHTELLNMKEGLNSMKLLLTQLSPFQKELLTVEEAMTLLSCNRNTLDKMIHQDKIINGYRLRRRIYLKRSEIMKAIEEGKIIPEQRARA